LVRDLDEETVERLKKRAREEGRSLQSEVKHILDQAAHEPTVDMEAASIVGCALRTRTMWPQTWCRRGDSPSASRTSCPFAPGPAAFTSGRIHAASSSLSTRRSGVVRVPSFNIRLKTKGPT
ncbi:MAG: Arc family DNA-binding protein, partial [Deltaproteobacteria bacterium]|nr:Arc family DNA-binding protein [Deltaproteobacteria bacterium]